MAQLYANVPVLDSGARGSSITFALRAQLADFVPVPCLRLPYRSILAASNDPCCPVRLAGAHRRAWGSELVRLENAGHINVAAGFGERSLGLQPLAHLGVSLDPAECLRRAA